MSEIRRILIVAYTFPPQGGIGGRRRAKFAKELLRQGYQVDVIAADMPGQEQSPWTLDVKEIPVFRFKTDFPQSLTKQPMGLVDKVRYRMALRKMVMKTQGTPYDRAALDQLSFQSLFRKNMDSFRPDLILATGAPFDLLYFTALELKNYPSVFSVADMRDPWINGSAFGYSQLSKRRLEAEKAKESEVMKVFDMVSMPWQKNIDELQQRHPELSKKLFVLPHFFDDDDMSSTETLDFPPDLIYGGGIYEGLEEYLVEFSAYCKQHKIKAEIRTSSAVNSSLQNEFFQVLPPLQSHQFFARVKSARYALLFLPEGNRYGLTKLFELAACGKPILAIGRKSDLSDLIEKESLGFFIDIHKLAEGLNKALNSKKSFQQNREWLSNHSLHSVTKSFMDLVKTRISNG